ncbi:MAG: transketolase, partial [Anaerolineales bacterium]|nr:transketolase [Anaerolineales bacterium]
GAAKERLGWPKEPRFFVPEDVLAFFRQVGKEGDEREGDWRDRFETYRADHPDLAQELERRLEGRLPEGWTEGLPTFSADPKGMATRAASGKVINAITTAVPDLIGGSADLAPSNKTWIDGSPDFQSQQYHGRNFHFGVREHAMGAIVNGMGLHGGVIPYAGTFLVFSDYMRPAVRLSALSKIPALWIYTHDSIGLGEDGPTHQPIEQLSSLRAIPGIVVIRPMDANEVVQAWKVAISDKKRPMALVLTRQNVPVVDRSSYASAVGLEKGAYVLADVGEGDPEIILMASGSEVDLILKAGEKLAEEGVSVRVVSFPSWELFEEQDQEYQDSVLLPDLKMRLAVEAGVGQGWYRWVGSQGLILSVETFGASAPGSRVFKEYGFTVENVINKARNLVKEER